MFPQGKEDYGIGQKKMNKVFGISLLRLLNKPKIGQWDNEVKRITQKML